MAGSVRGSTVANDDSQVGRVSHRAFRGARFRGRHWDRPQTHHRSL